MKRAFRGLLLNTGRVIADSRAHHHQYTHSYHHHHHRLRYDPSCISSALAQILPSSEHHHHHHHYLHDQPRTPIACEHAPSHQHPQSALRSIIPRSQRGQWTLFCNSSTLAASPPMDPQVVTLATASCPASVDRPHITSLAPSTLQAPMQNPSVQDVNIGEDFSHGATPCHLSTHEARKLLKLIKIDDLKKQLLNTGKHCMPLEEVLKICKETGAATSDMEAEEVSKSLDEAGFILIFRKKVFLEPGKVAEVLSKAMPLPLAVEDDPRNQEYARLLKEKEEIDRIAHKQVRNMLWGALSALSAQSILFFRLTFWELSWDVMEPIAFFVTSGSLLAGFFFFVITKRDPSYHDFMDTLFSSKQRKLIKKKNFDIERFNELQVMCCLPSSQSSSAHNHTR